MSAVREWLTNATKVMLQASPDTIADDSRFAEDLGIDSLDVLELVMLAEDQLHVSVDDDEIAGIETFGRAVTLIESKVAPQ